jgi:uncharacterized protein YjbI with pentapeptide repeats
MTSAVRAVAAALDGLSSAAEAVVVIVVRPSRLLTFTTPAEWTTCAINWRVELSHRQDSLPVDVKVSISTVPTADSPVPALRLWNIHRSITVAVIAALLLVGVMVAAAFWYAGWPSVNRDATVTARTLFELMKLVFAIVAGIGGVAALMVAYRRQRVAENTNALAEFAHQLAHAADLRAEVTKTLAESADDRAKIETDRNGIRLFNERFAKAAEQLGSEKAAVRLAGVYAMASLADDWRDGRQTCIDVLCGYLRMPYTPPNSSDEATLEAGGGARAEAEQRVQAAREEREVRRTVIRLIARRLRVDASGVSSWHGLDFDFTGAVFDGGDFSKVVFDGGLVSFAGARFCSGEVSFTEAAFLGGEVSFVDARFCGATVSFYKATFCGGTVSFSDAKFDSGNVFFTNAEFTGGEILFVWAKFCGARVSLDHTRFDGDRIILSMADAEFSDGLVSFEGAQLECSSLLFYRIKLHGGKVSFKEATFMQSDLRLTEASVSGGCLSFEGAIFRLAAVSFSGATFAGGEVSFLDARVDAVRAVDLDEVKSTVTFDRVTFDGGKVSFDSATFSVPLEFDPWLDGQLPAGVRLPVG